MHKYAFKKQYYLEIWMYQTKEKEKNQEQFLLHIVTMINTFLLLEALVKGMEGTENYVAQETFQVV